MVAGRAQADGRAADDERVPSGRKEVFQLRLASGREVEATANHPFMTFDGWTPLGELKVGDRLAVPRRVPEPVDTQTACPTTR